MTKENPLNRDPLYPKNRGYAFRGYAMDKDDVPTFLYAIGNNEVKDKTTIEDRAGKPVLTRTLTFNAPTPTTLYFRALAGRLEADSKGRFQLGKLRLSLESGEQILRPSTEKPDEKELLVKLDLATGETTFKLHYELND